MTVKVTGRVLQAKVADDSDRDFVVTLGPPPHLFWFRATGRPPHLGQRLSVVGEEVSTETVGEGDAKGSVTQLRCESFVIDTDTYASRHVPRAWIDSVRKVMARPLYRYQVEGAAWIANRVASGAGAILGDEPGVGKTAQTVAMLCALRPFPAVIVCPASLKQQWAREFQAAHRPPRIHIAAGSKARLPRGCEIYILNYDILYAREGELLHLNPALYVFDEAHELRNPRARGKHRAASATRLVRQRNTGAILLTGTPIENRPAELWRLLHLTSPKTWPRFADYAQRYLKPVRGKEIGRSVRTKAGRVERLNELHSLLDHAMLRRLKSEVLKDLPPKSRRSVLVQLDDASMAHYRAAEQDVVAWLLALGRPDQAAEAKKAESIVKLTMLRRIAAMGKLRTALPQYLESWCELRTKEPLVIFGYHRDVMSGLLAICGKLGLRAVGIGGGESSEKRQQAVDLFQSGKADVFLAPIRSAGVGLNLQRASEALFVERIWTPSGMIQAEDRIHRIGSKRPVVITYLDAAGTVDEHIARVVEAKQRLIRTVVDDDHQLSESLQTVQEVIADLLPKRNP
jgi:SNF2 family DNA or RNA helicase